MEPSSNKKIAHDAAAVVAKPRRRFKLTDIIAIVIFALVAFFLIKTITTQLSLKNEVSAARVVTDQVINDINKTDGSHARSLGDQSFQQKNSAETLTTNFKAVKSQIKSTPAVDGNIVTNDQYGQAVSVIYKYSQKPEFYVSIKAIKPVKTDKWVLAGINVETERSKLIAQ